MSLHVYSAGCHWHGPIDCAGRTEDLPETTAYVGKTPITIGGKGSGLPCCPHCGSVLFQIDSGTWWDLAKSARGDNYVAFLQWSMCQNKCWPNMSAAAAEYNLKNPNLTYNHVPRN